MNDTVLQRLKASKEKGDSALVTAGREAGRCWAENEAEYHELQRLAEAMEQDPTDTFIVSERNAFNGSQVFAFTVLNSDDRDHQIASDFWTNADLDEADHRNLSEDAFVQGFAEGALEVWDEVKDAV